MAITGSQAAYKHARANVLRLGTGRLNYFTPIEGKLTINGTDRSSLGQYQTFGIQLNSFDAPDICTGQVLAAAGFTPAAGQTLVVGVGQQENRIFGGRIESVTKTYLGGLPSLAAYDIKAVDNTRVLAKRRVMKRYLGADASQIVLDIIATYTSGVTTEHVQTGLGTIDDISFTSEPVPDAFTRIAERIPGCVWFVDAFGDLHFGTTMPVSPAPAALTNSSAVLFRNVRYKQDLSQVRTRVYVEGRGGKITEFQPPTGADLYVDTPSEIFNNPATDGRGNSVYYVRLKTLVVPYRDLDDTGFDHLIGNATSLALIAQYYAEGNSRIREGDEVNLWVQRDDTSAQAALAALEGGDGIREAYVVDRRLNQVGCEQRGDDELARLSTMIETLTYETTDVNAIPGRDVVVSLSSGEFAVSGTFRIKKVTIGRIGEAPGQAPSTRGLFPWRSVEATSATRLGLFDLFKRAQSPTFWSFS